jgi:hypothetical protein
MHLYSQSPCLSPSKGDSIVHVYSLISIVTSLAHWKILVKGYDVNMSIHKRLRVKQEPCKKISERRLICRISMLVIAGLFHWGTNVLRCNIHTHDPFQILSLKLYTCIRDITITSKVTWMPPHFSYLATKNSVHVLVCINITVIILEL